MPAQGGIHRLVKAVDLDFPIKNQFEGTGANSAHFARGNLLGSFRFLGHCKLLSSNGLNRFDRNMQPIERL